MNTSNLRPRSRQIYRTLVKVTMIASLLMAAFYLGRVSLDRRWWDFLAVIACCLLAILNERFHSLAIRREREADVIPRIRGSAFVIGLMSRNTDAAQCLRIGVALLLEKPLILVSLRGAWIPPKLRRLADAVLECETFTDPATQERMQAAIRDLLKRQRHAV
jgi:hypothetical protein